MNPDIKILLLNGSWGIVGTLLGLYGALRLKNEKNKLSLYYMSLDALISGVMCLILFLISSVYFYVPHINEIVKKELYYMLLTLYLGVVALVVGVFGYKKRERINNKSFLKLSMSSIYCGILIFFGTIIFCLLWGIPGTESFRGVRY